MNTSVVFCVIGPHPNLSVKYRGSGLAAHPQKQNRSNAVPPPVIREQLRNWKNRHDWGEHTPRGNYGDGITNTKPSALREPPLDK
jgi:hypothetical protein